MRSHFSDNNRPSLSQPKMVRSGHQNDVLSSNAKQSLKSEEKERSGNVPIVSKDSLSNNAEYQKIAEEFENKTAVMFEYIRSVSGGFGMSIEKPTAESPFTSQANTPRTPGFKGGTLDDYQIFDLDF